MNKVISLITNCLLCNSITIKRHKINKDIYLCKNCYLEWHNNNKIVLKDILNDNHLNYDDEELDDLMQQIYDLTKKGE